MQPTASDFRSPWAFALTEEFKTGRKPFIHSLEVILQSNYHWERDGLSTSTGMAQDPIIKINFAQARSEYLKVRGGEREKEVIGTESKL